MPAVDPSAPGPLVRSLVRAASAGRWSQVWAAVDPADQRRVPRALFVRCLRRVAAGAAIPLSEIPVRVVRVRGRGPRATVELRAATPVGPVGRTVYAVRVGSGWRLRLPSSLARPLAAGSCPRAV